MDDLSPVLASTSLYAPASRLPPSQKADIIAAAESFVESAFAHHDPSHDYHHVHRVRLLALSLTRSPEAGAVDKLVVELGALFHDLTDAKYSSSTTPSSVLAPFWADPVCSGVTRGQRESVEHIVSNVSWSKDERRRRTPPHHRTEHDTQLQSWLDSCREFHCVSDADRLDAIGSIGVLRPLYVPPNNPTDNPVPPAEQAEGYNGSAVGHFYEKLLKIRGDRLYTIAGRNEAERRQGAMRAFLDELDLEWLVGKQGSEMALLEDEEEEEGEEFHEEQGTNGVQA
uniref:HD/PDEase domain-containing protein n=1 Tax=Kalmanozyma brasiliensis (strain GHG001) TaxID=1365824 RepID=V5ETD8_KALBG